MENYDAQIDQSQHHFTNSRTTLKPKKYDFLLGYHQNNKERVEIISARLINEAGLKPHPYIWSLDPGESRLEDIDAALNDCTSCGLFLGPSGLARGQHERILTSLAERSQNQTLRVIPVLLENAEPFGEETLPSFLHSLVWVDFRLGIHSQEAFSHLVAAIRGRKYKALTHAAFHRLLDWLNQEAESGGQKYEEVRQKLISYFDRRNCRAPEDLADETLDRVALKLSEKDGIISVTPSQFCYIKAKQVLHEYWRSPDHYEVGLDELTARDLSGRQLTVIGHLQQAGQEREEKMKSLEHCLKRLKPQEQSLILRYYSGEERVKINNRQKLADELGITAKSLVVRALRIRKRLENCMERYDAEKKCSFFSFSS